MYLQIFNANFLQLPFRVIEDPPNYCTLNLADHTLRSPDVFIRTGGYTPAAQNFTPLAPLCLIQQPRWLTSNARYVLSMPDKQMGRSKEAHLSSGTAQ